MVMVAICSSVPTSPLGSHLRETDILTMTSMDFMSTAFLAWPDQGENSRKVFFVGLIIMLPLVVKYAVSLFMYHQQHLHRTEHQLPPEYPSFIPWLGSAIPFLLDNAAFLRLATYVEEDVLLATVHDTDQAPVHMPENSPPPDSP
jgi:hypothetical protein